jgi:hypothetical protein
MTHRLRARATLLLAALALLALAGCKLVTTPQATINVHVSVEIQRFLQGQTHISLRFSDPANNTIEFVSGETVACDGQFLRYALGFYVGDVPRQSDGGVHTFTYTPAASAASTSGATPLSTAPVTFSVKIVPAPVTFTQPVNGATVPIPTSAALTITYQPSIQDNTSMYAIASDSRYHISAVLPQPDSGTLTIPADQFADFQAGPGTLTLARQTAEAVGGTQFNGVDVQFKNVTVESIVWQ